MIHGQIDRRGLPNRAMKFAVSGMTAVTLLDSLTPHYALAQQIAEGDERIAAGYRTYPSHNGHEKTRGYLRVLVVHENRGLNPYVADVARRVATADFLGFVPDALAPRGGYPGTDDEGRVMQWEIHREKMTEDFIAAARYVQAHPRCTGKVGVVGFCFGGGMSNTLAVRISDVINAAAPFYGRQAAEEDVPKIKAPLMLHYAGNDNRVNVGWPTYEAALKEAKVDYTMYIYEETNHGFHNDTTSRYDEAAAKLTWGRTIDFFNRTLRGK